MVSTVQRMLGGSRGYALLSGHWERPHRMCVLLPSTSTSLPRHHHFASTMRHLLAQMLSAPDFLFLCIFEIPDERKTVAREWVSFREPQTAVQLSGFARLSTVKGLVGTETSQRKSLDYKTTGAQYGEHILQLGSHSGDESHRDPLPAEGC